LILSGDLNHPLCEAQHYTNNKSEIKKPLLSTLFFPSEFLAICHNT
jgi:hypothetical protein